MPRFFIARIYYLCKQNFVLILPNAATGVRLAPLISLARSFVSNVSTALSFATVATFWIDARLRAEDHAADAGTYARTAKAKFDAFRKNWLEKLAPDRRAVALAI